MVSQLQSSLMDIIINQLHKLCIVKFNGHNNKLYTYINAACTKILLPKFWLPISSNEFKTYKKGIDTSMRTN